MIVPLTLLALLLISALLVLVPTRRLYLAGWSQAVIAAYFLGMWALSVLVAWAPGPTRFLVPIVLVAYLAPFVTLRAGLDRLLGRPPRSSEPRNVTPPDESDPRIR